MTLQKYVEEFEKSFRELMIKSNDVSFIKSFRITWNTSKDMAIANFNVKNTTHDVQIFFSKIPEIPPNSYALFAYMKLHQAYKDTNSDTDKDLALMDSENTFVYVIMQDDENVENLKNLLHLKVADFYYLFLCFTDDKHNKSLAIKESYMENIDNEADFTHLWLNAIQNTYAHTQLEISRLEYTGKTKIKIFPIHYEEKNAFSLNSYLLLTGYYDHIGEDNDITQFIILPQTPFEAYIFGVQDDWKKTCEFIKKEFDYDKDTVYVYNTTTQQITIEPM